MTAGKYFLSVELQSDVVSMMPYLVLSDIFVIALVSKNLMMPENDSLHQKIARYVSL